MQTRFLIGTFFLWVLLGGNTACSPSPAQDIHFAQSGFHFYDFPDVLNLTGVPDSAFDRSVYIFADQGAWFGYALPGASNPEYNGSFSGPFLMTQENGTWVSPVLSKLEVLNLEADTTIDLSKVQVRESHSFPGRLQQTFVLQDPHLFISAELVFVDERTALQRIRIENLDGENPLPVQVRWRGNLFDTKASFQAHETGVGIAFSKYETYGLIAPLPTSSFQSSIQGRTYVLTSNPRTLYSGEPWELNLTHTFCFSPEELERQASQLPSMAADPEQVFAANKERWNQFLDDVLSRLAPPFSNENYQEVAVKCLQTLTTNWRSAAGHIQHQGLFPSYNYEWFHGFWAWDSWKHAAALAYFDPELAQDQIRAMYDFQDEMGMVADCFYRDTLIENHNWRDTKPPLSGWATWLVYEQSKDREFLEELWPKIERYHRWWYQYRDHDQNGVCEYGSTDGTLIAAKWESGMDNAVRFDDTELVQNNNQGWSMNRESVDLNAYLFAEKTYLARIAEALGQTEEATQYHQEAEALKEQIQRIFYDTQTAWFYDVTLDDKQQFQVTGAEGWIPLWAKAAQPVQAAGMQARMLDSTKFATPVPFPTLAADHSRFEPDGGYWRGPVWLDQAYFAITGLRNYGYEKEAEQLTLQLTSHMEGLMDSDLPIRENYHPLTGEGLEAQHFSWSAAHLLLLLWQK